MINGYKKRLIRLIPSIIQAYYRSRENFYQKIKDLPIIDSGVIEDNMAYVKLDGGLIFYGFLPTKTQLYIYKYFIDKRTKKKLKKEAINVAHDINIRYYGPENSEDIEASGKYYDFKKGDVVIEAGAYIGYYAMRVAKIVGSDGKVFAIEAVPENYNILKKNVEENHISNIVPINKAIWNKKTTMKFFREEKQAGSLLHEVIDSKNYLEVDADTLDNIINEYNPSKIDFVRIQLNGAEEEAIEGMKEILNYKPKLLVAGMYKKNGILVQNIVASLLKKLDYSTKLKGQSVFAWKD